METLPDNRGVFPYAVRVYDYMKEHADRDIETGDLYWTGTVTEVFRDLGITNANYSRVMNALKGMGSVKFKYRGGGAAKSELWIMDEPDRSVFEKVRESGMLKGTAHTNAAAAIREINTRISKLEASLVTIVKSVNDLMNRVALLEQSGDDDDNSEFSLEDWGDE